MRPLKELDKKVKPCTVFPLILYKGVRANANPPLEGQLNVIQFYFLYDITSQQMSLKNTCPFENVYTLS